MDRFGHAADNESVVVVEFTSPLVARIEDFVAYDVQSLIGEVGGTLGLYLGASLLSVADAVLTRAGLIFRRWRN